MYGQKKIVKMNTKTQKERKEERKKERKKGGGSTTKRFKFHMTK